MISSDPSKSSNHQVKLNHHSSEEEGELGIDIEQIDIDPAIPFDQYTSTNINTMEVDEADEDEDCEAEDDAAAGIHNKGFGFGGLCSCAILSKKAVFLLVAVAMLGVGVIAGFGLSGIVEYNRQQQLQQRRYEENALAAIAKEGGGDGVVVLGGKAGKGDKAGKACMNHDPIDDEEEFCEEDMVIACGDTFTNEKVVMSNDLFCKDNVNDATDDELEALNAAITVSGPDATIDCKGHSITQLVSGDVGSPCSRGAGSYEVASPIRKAMKEWCGIYYQAGIMLVDGAKAVNCDVGNFHDGFLILNGGEVKQSEASGNGKGVTVRDVTGSRESVVSDVYAHRNSLGILIANDAASNSVTISDVTSKLNVFRGLQLSGPVITVKDSTFNHNGYVGIAKNHGSHDTVNLQFEGTVSSHHNAFYGIELFLNANDSPKAAEVNIKGEVNTYLNGMSGLFITLTPPNTLQITLEGGKSKWNSCQNAEVDVYNNGDGFVSFIDEGSGGYTCDTSDERVTGTGLPVCVACPSCD